MTRPRELPPTLAERLTAALVITDGSMPLRLIVEGEPQKREAEGLLLRRPGSRVIEIMTRAEDAAEAAVIVDALNRERMGEPAASAGRQTQAAQSEIEAVLALEAHASPTNRPEAAP